jgi:serine/threonine protein kinase
MNEFIGNYSFLKDFGNQHKRKFGNVFLVEDKATREKFIVKQVKKSETNVIAQERLRNESVFQFDFPGLPRKTEFIETPENSILIKRFVEGETLEHFWNQIPRRNRPDELIRILQELVPIFDFLKNKHIVHADIKPSNILINKTTDKLHVSLIDFGMALDLNQPEQRTILFPIGYAAPELLLNKLDLVDHRTDLYALGISLWKLMDGKLPLFHPNPSIFTNLQLTHPLPFSAEISKKTHQLLSNMCSKYPFETAPNRISEEMVRKKLMEGMNNRYNGLDEFLKDYQTTLHHKKWYHVFSKNLF